MADIFAAAFTTTPYWWNGFTPPRDAPVDLPKQVGTLIVGAGYAGIACALRLAEAGRDVMVLDAGALGAGASSRSGGQVSGGVNIGKSPVGKPLPAARKAELLRAAADGFTLFETLIERHQIRCGYHRTGRLNGFWAPSHQAGWAARLDELNRLTGAEARILSRDEMAAEIDSSFYHGGVVIGRAGHIQPAEYYGGLLRAARTAGARAFGETKVQRINRVPGGFVVQTNRGAIRADTVVLTANADIGGTVRSLAPSLRRGVVPVTTHMIATEELPADFARRLLPTNRAMCETQRVTSHYRLSPDGRRLLYGGRATFFPLDERQTAKLLHRQLLKRFPQLAGTRISHSWGGRVAMTLDRVPHIGGGDGLYFALGCNGSGVTMMSYLGDSVAQKIIERPDGPVNAYDCGMPPTHPLYDGTPWFMPVLGTYFQVRDRLDRPSA
jgi:glycine/D-amino acid oxidase-like deaminating enzyme